MEEMARNLENAEVGTAKEPIVDYGDRNIRLLDGGTLATGSRIQISRDVEQSDKDEAADFTARYDSFETQDDLLRQQRCLYQEHAVGTQSSPSPLRDLPPSTGKSPAQSYPAPPHSTQALHAPRPQLNYLAALQACAAAVQSLIIVLEEEHALAGPNLWPAEFYVVNRDYLSTC